MQTDDNLTGAVEIKLRADRRPVMHRGVKIELIGQIGNSQRKKFVHGN